MKGYLRRSYARSFVSLIAALIAVSALSSTALGAPQVVTYFDLPKANTGVLKDQGNFNATALGRLDVLVGAEWIREYYTTTGRWDPSPASILYPGRLRPVDLHAPIPSLVGVAQPWPQGTSGNENWIIRPNIANWNQVLDGPDPENPLHGKRHSFQGIASSRGFLFVTVGGRQEPQLPGGDVTRWNGLSFFDGTDDPGDAFDPADNVGKELYSAGTGPLDPELRNAVPEGVEIAVTSPASPGSPGEFLFVANYCGEDAGGFVLVQNITNILRVNANARYLIPVYEHLGNYIDTTAPTSGPAARLGPEVPSSYFAGLNGINGVNKIRPVHVVRVKDDPMFPNRNRLLLIIGVNLDPVRLEPGDGSNCPVGAHCYPSSPVPMDTDNGTDDGKYDYVAIVDITDMVVKLPSPWPCAEEGGPPCADLWVYKFGAQWASRIRFLRLPPDLPDNWVLGVVPDPADELSPGNDWGMVPVPDPDPPGAPDVDVLTVGSGTISSISADPAGQAVYIVTNDQGNDEDGGIHVPHLYVLDLSAGDFTDQEWLNTYTPDVGSYRFNKVITHDFGSGDVGAINVATTIPLMPSTGSPIGPTLIGLGGPATPALGMVYPGENQFELESRTPLITVQNLHLPEDRLYVGLRGSAQVDPDTALDWPVAGAVLVLSLADPKVPSYLRTLTIPQVPAGEWYQVAGLDVLPPDATHLGTNLARNVFVVTARHSKGFTNGQDRLVIGEDP